LLFSWKSRSVTGAAFFALKWFIFPFLLGDNWGGDKSPIFSLHFAHSGKTCLATANSESFAHSGNFGAFALPQATLRSPADFAPAMTRLEKPNLHNRMASVALPAA
jgi:hypothetical protein